MERAQNTMNRLNRQRIGLVNLVQERIQAKIKSSRREQQGEGGAPCENITKVIDDCEVEDIIPPYHPNENEMIGKILSPPDDMTTLIPASEFFWLISPGSSKKEGEDEFSSMFKFPNQADLYWRLKMSNEGSLDSNENEIYQIYLLPAAVPKFHLKMKVELETFAHKGGPEAKKTTMVSFAPNNYKSVAIGTIRSRLFSYCEAVTIKVLIRPAMVEDEFLELYDCL